MQDSMFTQVLDLWNVILYLIVGRPQTNDGNSIEHVAIDDKEHKKLGIFHRK